ncbi:MAG TPA: nucleotidyltransferase family protein [Thermoanaerobaculia bacterium]|nr:nucleotidyltransferase family protein [Thermoanaerobaculia bacterium]
MTREDRILFLCARQDFQPGHREAVEVLGRGPVRWQRLADAADRHGVLPIAGSNLRSCDLELAPGLAERLETAVFENALRKEQDALQLAAGLARLRAVGLEALLLKGASLDLLVYTEPWVVASRDTDLLLRPLPGYRPGPEEKSVRRSLYRAGIECDLLGHHDLDMHGVLPVSTERIWRAARPIDFRGAEAWVMGPEDLLISLCINACRKRFVRLKGLFDLAETVARTGIDWPRLGALARGCRCEGIVFAALLAARQTLGCALPDGALAELGVRPGQARLLRLLVAAAGTERKLALLLPYASFRPEQAWRSVRVAFTHRPVPFALRDSDFRSDRSDGSVRSVR